MDKRIITRKELSGELLILSSYAFNLIPENGSRENIEKHTNLLNRICNLSRLVEISELHEDLKATEAFAEEAEEDLKPETKRRVAAVIDSLLRQIDKYFKDNINK